MLMKNIRWKYAFLLLFIFLSSCEKFTEIKPPGDQLVNPQPFLNEASANAAITGIYEEMMRLGDQFANSSTTLIMGLYSDELHYYSPSFRDEFYNSNITESNHTNITSQFWQPAYVHIYAANLNLEQLDLSKNLAMDVKKRLVGEAKFIRAFCYFYLVNIFGDVPLQLSSDYRVNSFYPRTDANEVYDQIINDLNDACTLLPEHYVTQQRVRPNKWAAYALLSRVHLYLQQWAKAEQLADEIISSGMYSLESEPADVFLKSSNEAIWQLQPVNPFYNTWEGNRILPSGTNSIPTYLVNVQFVNAFDERDKRKTAWINSRQYLNKTLYYPYKYKVFGRNAPVTEYNMVLRLAEQYLIRAEARAKQNKVDGALDDLNIIRTRANLPIIVAHSQEDLINLITNERRLELCFEWGHRWFDLKRTNTAYEVLSGIKPEWENKAILFPIPIDQIKINPALKQNPGY